MRNIIDIYNHYGIPEHLQLHMLRVAGCGVYILDNWNGPKIDKNSLIRVLLLHDMGNLVKIVEPCTNEQFLLNREKYQNLYGNDDHAISNAIAKELGLTDEEIVIMNEKIFMNNEKTKNGTSYEIKIGAYCDQRVAPNGIYSLEDRMNEGKERYKDRPGTSFNNPKTDLMIECANQIEKQIMEFCSIKPTDITDEIVSYYINQLKDFEI